LAYIFGASKHNNDEELVQGHSSLLPLVMPHLPESESPPSGKLALGKGWEILQTSQWNLGNAPATNDCLWHTLAYRNAFGVIRIKLSCDKNFLSFLNMT